MAKELKDGISRELRYMEYKLRKKRSDKDKEKKKTKQNQYGKNYPTMDEYSSASVSSDMKQAMPSSTGEEDLQLQVALAVSREEAKEKERQEKNDKLKLEMALKESETAAKAAPQNQPKPTMDPWGGEAPAVQPAQNSFDPFGGPGSASQAQTGAWGAVAANASNNVQTQQSGGQWSPPKNAALVLPPPQKVTAKPLDPWGPSASASAPVSKPPPADPWAGDLSTQTPTPATSWDTPIGQPATTSFPASNGVSFDAFAPNQQTGFEANGTFDPLKEFDSLHISAASPSAPAHSIASTNVMVPMMAPTNSEPLLQPQTNGFDVNDNEAPGQSTVTDKAGAFLGENASLVNVENLVSKPKANTYYQTLSIDNTGALGSRNPFNQKGPSLSLNQMKGGTQFGAPPPTAPQQMPMMNPTPMSMPPTGYGMAPSMPMQPAYGMQAQMAPNPFGQPVSQMSAFPQQNQSLF